MKFGFITTEGGTYFQEALEEAVYGEELGFDSVWLEEHHSIRNHYWPSPLMALAAWYGHRRPAVLSSRTRGRRHGYARCDLEWTRHLRRGNRVSPARV